MITMASASIGAVVGGTVGSAGTTYRWMKRGKVNDETATLAGIVPGLFDNIVLVLVSTIGLIYLIAVHKLSRLELLGYTFAMVGLLVVTAILVWGLSRRESFTKVISPLNGPG